MVNTPVDWQFRAKSLQACKACNDCAWTRGKMLGGSTSMNLMMYIRGNRNNYDKWTNVDNCDWNYDNTLRYFKKCEGNQYEPFLMYKAGKFHSAKQPMRINFTSPIMEVEEFFKAAYAEEGTFKYIEDIQSDHGNTGYTRIQGFVYDGIRQSAAEVYLHPTKDRKNLHVVKHATVTNILIDRNNMAYGVEYIYKNKEKRRAIATKEVILSAGAIMSPPILMASGIGPAKYLQQNKIAVKSDLPVGKGMIDHIYTILWHKANPSNISCNPVDYLYDYIFYKSGPFADPLGSLKINLFHNSNNATSEDPNIQSFALYLPKNAGAILQPFFQFVNYKKQFQDQISAVNAEHDLVATVVVLVQPKSIGEILLNKTTSYNLPIIRPNHFADEEDMLAMLNGLKYQLKLCNTTPYKQAAIEMIHMRIPECDRYTFKSDQYLKCYIRYFSSSCLHTTGTSKMGANSDPTAVVDPFLRVRGIKNLRQIDAGMYVVVLVFFFSCYKLFLFEHFQNSTYTSR